MIILACGDRNWTDFLAIYTTLQQYQNKATLIVHGGARGADTLAGEAAEALYLPIKVFRANWDAHGKAAGPIRNIEMFKKSNPDLVIAFHDKLSSSKGTKHMVDYARSRGAKVILVSSKLEITEFVTLM